jgi:hypothetical protein
VNRATTRVVICSTIREPVLSSVLLIGAMVRGPLGSRSAKCAMGDVLAAEAMKRQSPSKRLTTVQRGTVRRSDRRFARSAKECDTTTIVLHRTMVASSTAWMSSLLEHADKGSMG